MGVKAWLRIDPPPLKTVSSQDAEAWLANLSTTVEKEVSADLFQFGNLLLDQVRTFTDALETKATTLLGFSIALMVYLVFSADWISTGNWPGIVLSLVSLGSTGIALFASALALAVSDWPSPSQVDWLRHDLFNDPDQLRQYWVLSMLETHTAHAILNRRKAACVVVAQWSLVLAGLAVGITALLELFLRL